MAEIKKVKVGDGVVAIGATAKVQARAELYIHMYKIALEHKDLAKQIASNDIAHMNDEIKEVMISILFAYTCLEGYINTIGKDLLKDEWNHYKGKSVSIKYKWTGISKALATKKCGKPCIVFSDNEEPFRSFLELKRIREEVLVHRQAEFGDIADTKYGRTEGTINVLNCDKAEWACDVVKNMVKKMYGNTLNHPSIGWLEKEGSN